MSSVKQTHLQRGYLVEEVEVEANVKRNEPLDELQEHEPDEPSYPEVNQLLESGELSHLAGEEQMARIKGVWGSGNTDKAGTFPNLELRNNADEQPLGDRPRRLTSSASLPVYLDD